MLERMQNFSVWAPNASTVELVVDDITHPMTPGEVWTSDVTPLPGMRYGFRVDGQVVPDPRATSQPDGVHGLSEVTDASFDWQHPWTGQQRSLIYELHVGSFGGDFYGVIEKLPYLQELGVGAIELMPVQPFAGTRNWGYDGVFWHAVHAHYGGPRGLKTLIDAAHGHGIAVYLDVVYNHFGPEGNYLNLFGPYTVASPTGWGDAVNMTNPHVRAYILDAVRRWFTEFRVDGLRLDATHAYTDESLLDDIAAIAREVSADTGVKRTLIAEDLRDDPTITTSRGMDLQWNDSIHHSLHAIVSGERHAYYRDFGTIAHLVDAINHRYPSVVYTTTHDQVGNRPRGDRPSQNLSAAQQLLKAAIIAAIPEPTMLFMGEEYGAQTPFPFFCSHSDAALVRGTINGRREQFRRMGLDDSPLDPSLPETFDRARLDFVGDEDISAGYREILALGAHATAPIDAVGGPGWLAIQGALPLVANLSERPVTVPYTGDVRYSPGTPVVGAHGITLEPWGFAFLNEMTRAAG